MASPKRRKTAALALAFVGVAGLSIASAAQLNLGTGSLGAGTEIVASCQQGTTPIAVSFTNAFVPGTATIPGKYEATEVVLSAIHAACDNLNYKVTLTDATGAAIDANGAAIGGELSGTIVQGGIVTIPVAAGVSAELITGVAVVIYS